MSKEETEARSVNFIREVDEELQAEKLIKIWAKYGDTIITMVVVVVLAAAGAVGYREYVSYQRSKASQAYLAAAQTLPKSPYEAQDQLQDLAGSSVKGYRLLGYVRQAETYVGQGKFPEAVAVFQKARREGGFTDIYNDYLLMREGYLALNMEKADTAVLAKEVEGVMARRSFWMPAFYEIQALVALKSGDQKKALENYQVLASDVIEAPASMKQRASQMIRLLGQNGIS